MGKKKRERLSSRGLPKGVGASVKGHWVVCFNCDGYGRNMQYIGQPHCDWCNGTGLRYNVTIKASAATKEAWLTACEEMIK